MDVTKCIQWFIYHIRKEIFRISLLGFTYTLNMLSSHMLFGICPNNMQSQKKGAKVRKGKFSTQIPCLLMIFWICSSKYSLRLINASDHLSRTQFRSSSCLLEKNTYDRYFSLVFIFIIVSCELSDN